MRKTTPIKGVKAHKVKKTIKIKGALIVKEVRKLPRINGFSNTGVTDTLRDGT
jgi:hypothetical protein